VATPASVLVLYIGPNCHLCADAAILLDELIGADPELLPRYAGRVPVVAVDGVDRLEAPITGPDLWDLMAELGVSV